jgi:phage protein D
MFKVNYKIDIGSTRFRAGQSSRLLSLETRASLGVPVNFCRIVLDATEKLSVKPGDEVKIELGYDKSLSRVFTGQVASFEPGIQQISIESLGALTALTTAHFNLLYEKQTAADIVGNVLTRLKLKKAKVETGLKFATYTLGDSRSVWEQLQTLAQRCGFDFYANEQDQVVFKKYSANKTHELKYGVHILEFEQMAAPPVIEGVEVYGESPAGQGQSEEASSWLTKKPVKGKTGKSTGNVLRVIDASLRNKRLAQDAADNLMNRYKISERGKVCALGAPEIKLGDAVKIADMPISSQNGQFKITAVRHRLNWRSGFTTDIEI